MIMVCGSKAAALEGHWQLLKPRDNLASVS